MLEEILGLTIDLLFAAVGIAVVAVQLARRRRLPALRFGPRVTWLELVLTVGALTVAAVGPNVLVFALTPGMPGMPVLARYALVPAFLLLVVVWAAAAGFDQRRLANRIWVGLWVGAATTGVLDAIRLTGFQLGLMPGNMPRMFGVLILDRMALGPSLGSDILGYLYHYWVGACFGLTYTLLLGRFHWWGGLVWGLIIEVGMMVTPPMVVAMDTGYFGVKFGPGLFATSLVAHVVYGSVLGALAGRHVVHGETLFRVLREKFRHLEDAGAQHAVVQPRRS